MPNEQRLDIDLVRQVLLGLERGEDPEKLPSVREAKVRYHQYLMADAGFIDRLVITGGGATPWPAVRITWAGQEFLQNARSDTLWSKGKAKVMSGVGTLSLEALKVALAELAKQAMG
ncbi:MAG TPA: DUF2513 domain-containing protein [Candidatus Kapabacteria bacterium]|nr:DUF2513 domain-containing protein [Candidatus Kapabacteria bacterium]